MTYVHRMIERGIQEGIRKARREAELTRQENELKGKLQIIQGFLGRAVPWATIEAATGIDEAAFGRLKQQFDEALAVDHGDVDRADDDAGPLGSATVSAAAALVIDLPSDLPTPDVCATPKGEIDLTWFVPGGTVSLSIGPDGRDIVLTATLDDGREYSGREPWRGNIPATMKCCLRDICIE